MIIFWILAAGLLGLALAFTLAPLLRPTQTLAATPDQDALNLRLFQERLAELDQDLEAGFLERDRYDAARHDLERELLYDVDGSDASRPAQRPAHWTSRWLLAALLLVAVPASTVLLYLQTGDPGTIGRLESAAVSPGGPDGSSAPALEELVKGLEERLAQEPDNLDGWLMLGRTYFATGQAQEGLAAVEKAYGLAPERTDVMLAYAEALAAASPDKRLDGRPAELIRSVLEREPENPAARWLAGMIAFQQGQYQSAAVTWRKILDQLDPDSEEAANLGQMVAEAQSRAGIPSETTGTTPAPEASVSGIEEGGDGPSQASDARLDVQVTLDEAIADRASPEDTLFVLARAAQGPAMPLAVQRLQVKDLPTRILLDDSMAMTPAMRLSAFDEVVVVARVSKSGDAMPQAGDLVGESDPISLDRDREVSIRIDRVKP